VLPGQLGDRREHGQLAHERVAGGEAEPGGRAIDDPVHRPVHLRPAARRALQREHDDRDGEREQLRALGGDRGAPVVGDAKAVVDDGADRRGPHRAREQDERQRPYRLALVQVGEAEQPQVDERDQDGQR
jgi:hypothetical protein